MSADGDVLEKRLDVIESEMRSMQTDVNYVKAEMSRLGRETERITDTLTTVAETVARIDGSIPHMATKAEVEKASHSATKGMYAGLSAVALAVLALVAKFWPSG